MRATAASGRARLFSLTLFTLLGIMLMISANNLLVIYLGLELQSLSMYTLVALRRDDPRASEAAMKYFVLGVARVRLSAVRHVMLYGATGTLDIDELARPDGRRADRQAVASLVLGIVFVVAGLAFKFGVVPFHMWVPDVYQGAPTPITTADQFGARSSRSSRSASASWSKGCCRSRARLATAC